MRPLFIGWAARAPLHLRAWLRGWALGLPLALLGLGLLLGLAPQDPAGPRFAVGAMTPPPLPEPAGGITGTLTLHPYPVLHAEGGRALLLGGDGKRGAAGLDGMEGQRVTLGGFLLPRGDLAMLVLDGPPRPAPGEARPPLREELGRWRITGEICDGKCAAGGMRPGSGLAHRACAVLCLDGGLPAVLVTPVPLLGQAYLLLAGPDGGPPGPVMLGLAGRRLVLEGAVERLGTLLVFRAEPPG